jgi:chromosome segregation ATPase
MGETNVTTQGKSTVATSGGKEGSTSTQTPKTYTEEQVQKKLSDALAEQGRKHKAELEPIVKERDSFKSQLEANTSDLEANKSEIDKLQAKIDDLASNDPARFDAVKEMKALKTERDQLRADKRALDADKQALDADKQTHGERIKKAESFERETLIQGMVEDYEGGDFDKLKDFCETFDAKSEEQIRKVADKLWTKKAPEPPNSEAPPVKPYTGMTNGGSEKIGDLPPKQWEEALKKKLNSK